MYPNATLATGWPEPLTRRNRHPQVTVKIVDRGASNPVGADALPVGEAVFLYPFDAGEPAVRLFDQWMDAGTVWTESMIGSLKPQSVIVDRSARPIITDRRQIVLEHLLPLLERTARKSFMPVSKIEVKGFVDPEEDTEEIVVIQWVKVTPDAALNYWEKVGAVIGHWTGYLPEPLRAEAIEHIAFEVRWETDGTAI